MPTRRLTAFRTAIANPAWICFTWFGMTAGISLLATPLRFTAPTVTRAVGLDIGRVVFTALNRAELVALIILLIVVRASGRSRNWWGICGALALVVIMQSAWLLPELAARADIVVAGGEPPPSPLHGIYSTLELAKLALLAGAGFYALAGDRTARTRQPHGD
ncbi:MAG TPA: hypothetical protein VFY03_01535 [Woeseiaceae bacterium]|nr:hypothetical protein [Woeseiaceae bacterium]